MLSSTFAPANVVPSAFLAPGWARLRLAIQPSRGAGHPLVLLRPAWPVERAASCEIGPQWPRPASADTGWYIAGVAANDAASLVTGLLLGQRHLIGRHVLGIAHALLLPIAPDDAERDQPIIEKERVIIGRECCFRRDNASSGCWS